jgi:putative sigma-54 modulation protein
MQITITGHHVEITDGIREAVQNKLGKLQNKFPDMASLSVIATVEKNQQTVEVSTHFLGQDVTAKASASDLYAAIAETSSKLTRLMKSQKEKVKAHPHVKPQQVEEETVAEEEDYE